jgi:hypothetical protein
LAADGEIGHVDDFLIDEGCNKEIRVKLRRDEIETSPSVDTAEIELIETLPPVLIV